MPYKHEKECPECGKNEFESIPDSLAYMCTNCGFVWVGSGQDAERGASIQEWIKDIVEASEKKGDN